MSTLLTAQVQFILLLWGWRAGVCGSEDAARKCPWRFPLLYDLNTMVTVLYWISWALHNMASVVCVLPDMDGQVVQLYLLDSSAPSVDA